MSSTFGVFESAKSGLSVSMQQLNVTEQNIANVNTVGYTRQRILTSAKEPATSSYLIAQLNKAIVGQGVEATGIQQIRSSYLDQQYRNLNTDYSYTANRSNALDYLTGLYNELDDESSLTTAINSFYASLNTFSTDTSSKEYRTNVQQQALSMTQSFNNVYEQMKSLWNDQNDSIATAAQKINSIAQKIAGLNNSIASAMQTGGSANDLNDERNLLLDELSGYVNITYSPNADNENMIDVAVGGVSLVSGKTANQITVNNSSTDIDNLLTSVAGYNSDPTANAADLAAAVSALSAYGFTSTQAASTDPVTVSFNGVTLVSGTTATSIQDADSIGLTSWIEFNRNTLVLDGSDLDIGTGGAITGGQLYSNIEMITNQNSANSGIPYYMDQLNGLVREIAQNMNAINQSGYTYPYTDEDGVAQTSTTGVNLFEVPSISGVEDYTKLTAGNFTLSSAVNLSAYNIAGSSQLVDLSGSSTQTGNNDNALLLFGDLANSTYYDKLNSIVGNLAIAANTSTSIMNTKESLLDSVDTQRSSLSAVSLDEETTNLIIFQQSYNACAKIISTLDEMLNTLINGMGAQ